MEIDNSKNGSFFVKCFGCQYNEWDSSRLSFLLGNYGLAESNESDAEIVLILNCSVRKSAVDRSFGMVKNYLKSGKTVIITGCVLPDDRKKFERKGCLVWDGENIAFLDKTLELGSDKQKTKSDQPKTNLVPIMKGCNNFCSYCAVPYTRGREVSRPMEDILNDAKKIIASGQKEIILLGQNVNSYHDQAQVVIPAKAGIQHSNLDPRVNLPGGQAGPEDDKHSESDFSILLRKINDLPGDFTISFTSNHPKDMTDDIIEAVATLPKVKKSIHLPVQSGSNKVLQSMNRPYTKEDYLKLVEILKFKIPNLIVSTDVIVGYPTETLEDFEETAELLRTVKYDQVYINKYSPRSGTKAFSLGDPIPWTEKERRWRVLNEIVCGYKEK